MTDTASASGLPTGARELTLRRKLSAAAILLSFGVVAVAERDLKARPSEQVRGPKLLWRIGSTNALVAIAYLLWGRNGG